MFSCTIQKSARRVIALCLLVSLIGGGALAQEEVEQKGMDTVIPSISMVSIDVQQVLLLLAKYSGLNFTTTKEVTGNITVELSDVTVRDVLETALKDNGFNYIETPGGIVRIMTQEQYEAATRAPKPNVQQAYTPKYVSIDDLQAAFRPLLSKQGKITVVPPANKIIVSDQKEIIAKIDQMYPLIDSPLSTRVFRLKYIDADMIKQQLQELIDTQRGQMQIDKERNVIILTTTSENLEKAAKIIQEFDFELDIEVVEIQFTEVEDVAKMIKPLLSKDGYIEIHEQSSRIIIRDIPSRIEQALNVIEMIDVPPQAVWIESEIVNVNMNKLRDLGVNWAFGEEIEEPTNTNPIVQLINGRVNYVDFTKLSGKPLSVEISALESKGVTQVLASPRILVLNDEEAEINVGSEEPFLVRQRYTSRTGSDSDVYTQRTRQVGITLTVTPHISRSGYVSMEINLEDSTPRRVQLNDQTGLAVDQRKTNTKVLVKDGRTVALGGLIRRESSDNRSGVPVLSKIPVLGYPFRNTSKDESRQKLLLFLTPKIVSIDDPYQKYQYDDSLKYRMYEEDGVLGWEDKRQDLLDKDNPDAWYYEMPLEERRVYEPDAEQPPSPIRIPAGDYPAGGALARSVTPCDEEIRLTDCRENMGARLTPCPPCVCAEDSIL
jgi:type II secretory pathway component GspD/PulD (secretin)